MLGRCPVGVWFISNGSWFICKAAGGCIMTINKNPHSCKTSLISSDEAVSNNSKLLQRNLEREKVLLPTPARKIFSLSVDNINTCYLFIECLLCATSCPKSSSEINPLTLTITSSSRNSYSVSQASHQDPREPFQVISRPQTSLHETWR